MVSRWVVFVVTAFLFSAVVGQSYPGYYIDRDGTKKDAVFLIAPALFSKQPDFGKIVTGIHCIENGRKNKLTPAMCQSVHFKKGDQQIEFLSLPNFAGKDFYHTDSIFLRPEIIGPATMYYFYYSSSSPALFRNDDGTICSRQPGPLSFTKQGWLIVCEDGSILRITRKCRKKSIAEFFNDYDQLSGVILTQSTRTNIKNTDNLVTQYNTWKQGKEFARDNIRK